MFQHVTFLLSLLIFSFFEYKSFIQWSPINQLLFLCTFKYFLFIFEIIKYLHHHVILFSRNFFPSSVSLGNDILLHFLWCRILYLNIRGFICALTFLCDEWYQFIYLVFGYFPCEFWFPLSTKFLHMKKMHFWIKNVLSFS